MFKKLLGKALLLSMLVTSFSSPTFAQQQSGEEVLDNLVKEKISQIEEVQKQLNELNEYLDDAKAQKRWAYGVGIPASLISALVWSEAKRQFGKQYTSFPILEAIFRTGPYENPRYKNLRYIVINTLIEGGIIVASGTAIYLTTKNVSRVQDEILVSVGELEMQKKELKKLLEK